MLVLASPAACGDAPPAADGSGTDALEPDGAAGRVPDCPPAADGRLEGSLRGALQADIGWHGETLACDGMQRPDGLGGRLYFAGDLADGSRLTVVIGVDRLREGLTGRELDANLTLVLQDRGLFFGSRQREGCWADVQRNEPLDGGGHRVSGEVWCVRPLVQIGGDAAVTVPSLNFSGVLFDDDEDSDQT